MAAFHIGGIAALFFFTWHTFFVAIVLCGYRGAWESGWAIIGCSHIAGTELPSGWNIFLTFCGTLSLEGGPIFWVATQRIHHRFTDQEGDPHSPRDGKWWAHMGWILIGKSMHHDTTTLTHYVLDLAKDRFHVWITKYQYLPITALGLVLLAIGGLPFLLWGVFLRTVVGLHGVVSELSYTYLGFSSLRNTR